VHTFDGLVVPIVLPIYRVFLTRGRADSRRALRPQGDVVVILSSSPLPLRFLFSFLVFSSSALLAEGTKIYWPALA
jgi:hypothetical protein